MSKPEISIPSTATSPSPKPHTIYNISLRLPLRSFTLQKRYSDFLTLHSALLTSAAGGTTTTPPPAPLPPKSYFTSSLTSAPLRESRRQGLEAYLLGINTSPDPRWRDTPAWRTFLNLPPSSTARSGGAAAHAHAHATGGGGGPITDPLIWLDQHRALKALLHDARLALTRRDQADTTATAVQQHEAGAEARRSLVRAGTVVAQLERGLEGMGGGGGGWGGGGVGGNNHDDRNKLGEGEVRRRKDLLASARREREGLENLLGAMVRKERVDGVVAGGMREREEKKVLFGAQNGGPAPPGPRDGAAESGGGGGGRRGGGRVLGAKETEKTKQLDNQGVLQLQQTMMSEQDEDVMVLAKAVARQKELGMQIQEELAVQNDYLGLLDEDVDRVQRKTDVARERLKKIS